MCGETLVHLVRMVMAARSRLAALPETAWRSALGAKGPAYRTVWRILDGAQ
ncbi:MULTISPECIES: hypothetical protein [Streptomyces]|uniref:Transposase n=1 Tax=Streptomyces thermogriseus TaxID=75292 RepID=A0ABP4DKC2_9ACTN|nr:MULTISPECIES: hypothetical protein [unclassified Streptomyces]MDN5383014.1 hypothetical protein [Streptomyces sp. LB8]